MFEQLIQRENAIFDILQIFLDSNMNFILVGGYAVSSFKHRFSMDADVVIKSEDLDKFEDTLRKNNFKRTISKELNNLYSTKFIRFEKNKELKISIDLFIDGIGIRQTNSVISFDKINKNSSKRKVEGTEKEIEVKIPIRELLIALKLQSGRLTDFRDIVALFKNVETSKVKEFMKDTDKNILKKNIKHLISLLNKKEFIDSFKGVFIEKKYDINIEEVKSLKGLV